MIRRLKTDILKSLPPKTRRRIVVEIEDEALRKQIFDDFREFLNRSGEAAMLAKKKSRLMQIAMNQLNDGGREASAGGAGGAGAKGRGKDLSSRELADRRKSLLMQLFKNTGIAKLVRRLALSS